MNQETLKNPAALMPVFALVAPSVAGAALKVFIMGGSDLPADQMARACGSPHLMSKHGHEIYALVSALEAWAGADE